MSEILSIRLRGAGCASREEEGEGGREGGRGTHIPLGQVVGRGDDALSLGVSRPLLEGEEVLAQPLAIGEVSSDFLLDDAVGDDLTL